MTDQVNPIIRLLENDPRYQLEAYQFVREGLTYAQEVMKLGSEQPPADAVADEVERHLTGPQLCEAIREYALEQYGYMAQVVLRNWGLKSTSDLGNIVYNLIDVELMKKSKYDRREDFNDVYSFETAFKDDFRITPPSA